MIEVKQLKPDEHIQLVLTTDQADMGASKLDFWASVVGFVRNYCRDVWHRVL